jgi:two-component system OmpR family sensor kinase
MYQKILGGLLGGAVGDAMGAPTEGRSTIEILRHFGHAVCDFEKPPADSFGAGNEAGQLTDDFSSAYFIARHIVDHDGDINGDIVREAIIDWSEHAVFFDRFVGPTTLRAIRRFKGEKIEDSGGLDVATRQATNGSGMKISPIGLFNPGNLDQAIADAVTVTLPTHDNHLAISGACAVAAAVSRAMLPDADLYNVVQAGLYGASEGESIGLKVGKEVAGASVVRRMEMAVDIALGAGTPWEKMIEIGDRIGSGLHVAEAIPAAFGLFVAILFIINSQVTRALKNNYLDEEAAKSLANANIIAIAGKDIILYNDPNSSSFIRSYSEQMEARILVIDQNGNVTADSFEENWLIGQPLTYEEVDAALKGEEVTGVYELDTGKRVLYAVVPVVREERIFGAVMLVSNLEEIYATLDGISQLITLFSIAGGIFALLVSLFLSNQLSDPVNKLAAAVRRVSDGHLDQRVDIDSNDEIGILADDFNEMAAKLEETDRTLRNFLADASHELKTPLSSIKVLSQSLIDSQEQDPAVYRDFLQDISSEADRMSALVNDMFELTKLQGDIDRPVPLKNLQVEGLLNHIKGLVQGDALQKGLDIWVQVGGYGQISWPLNQDLFTHIMLNLASNAIRFTPDGGRVTVSADIEGEELVVRVQDTGIGISQEELPHIYDRFYRVAQDRNRDTGGTGLGLAITRQAVLRHGGTIDVESTPGDGTTFEVRFPYINSSYIET